MPVIYVNSKNPLIIKGLIATWTIINFGRVLFCSGFVFLFFLLELFILYFLLSWFSLFLFGLLWWTRVKPCVYLWLFLLERFGWIGTHVLWQRKLLGPLWF